MRPAAAGLLMHYRQGFTLHQLDQLPTQAIILCMIRQHGNFSTQLLRFPAAVLQYPARLTVIIYTGAARRGHSVRKRFLLVQRRVQLVKDLMPWRLVVLREVTVKTITQWRLAIMLAEILKVVRQWLLVFVLLSICKAFSQLQSVLMPPIVVRALMRLLLVVLRHMIIKEVQRLRLAKVLATKVKAVGR